MHITQLGQLAVLAMAGLTLAHPGAHGPSSFTDVAKRNFLHATRQSLNKCASHMEKRGINARAKARREALLAKHRKRSFRVRDTDTVLNTDHESDLDVTADTDESVLFSDSPVCILAPEGEIGPFWVKGELIRSDITDGEPGVPVILDGQFIDTNTCEPIEGLYWDIWSCNSTGVYSGVDSANNGNGDASNLDNTALRGIQPTDSDGVAQFKTIFPGHYAGRTTHYHIVAHLDATVLENNTLTGGSIPHIGQMFFDQSLINEVEATSPYNTNTVAMTLNSEDRVVSVETANSDSDPFFEYAYLGDSIEDGLLAWVTLGVDTTADHEDSASYAATLTANGGVSNSGSSGSGGGPGGAGGAGGPP